MAANDNIALKQCFKCLVSKERSEFYRHKQMGDGLLGACKERIKAAVRSNYARNRNHYVEYDKQREQTPERRAFKARAEIKHRTEHPEKYRARTAVHNAVRDGKLTKQPCGVCGATEQIHAHHHDYSKPLDVEWLCKDCHWAHHNAERRAG